MADRLQELIDGVTALRARVESGSMDESTACDEARGLAGRLLTTGRPDTPSRVERLALDVRTNPDFTMTLTGMATIYSQSLAMMHRQMCARFQMEEARRVDRILTGLLGVSDGGWDTERMMAGILADAGRDGELGPPLPDGSPTCSRCGRGACAMRRAPERPPTETTRDRIVTVARRLMSAVPDLRCVTESRRPRDTDYVDGEVQVARSWGEPRNMLVMLQLQAGSATDAAALKLRLGLTLGAPTRTFASGVVNWEPDGVLVVVEGDQVDLHSPS